MKRAVFVIDKEINIHILMCFGTLCFLFFIIIIFCYEASNICPLGGNKLKPFQQDKRTLSGHWVMQHSQASAHNLD